MTFATRKIFNILNMFQVYKCKWNWPLTSWVQWKHCAERWSSFSLPFSCIQIWSQSTLHHKAREAPSLLCCIHCEFLDTQVHILILGWCSLLLKYWMGWCGGGQRREGVAPISVFCRKSTLLFVTNHLSYLTQGGGHICPPARICVYLCKYTHKVVEKTWLFPIIS